MGNPTRGLDDAAPRRLADDIGRRGILEPEDAPTGRRAGGWSDADAAPGRRAQGGARFADDPPEAGRRFADDARPTHAWDDPCEATDELAAPARRAADDDPAPATPVDPPVDPMDDDDTAVHPIVVDDPVVAEREELVGGPDEPDELAPRRRAIGPRPPYVPARRNLRLVVGLAAVVASVALPLTAAGIIANDQTAATAVPEVVATPTPTPTFARLPPPEPVAQRTLDAVPAAVPGIAQPCPVDFHWDDAASQRTNVDRMQQQWGITFDGPEWGDPRYADAAKVFASTLDAVDCTAYLDKVKAGNGGQLTVSSSPPRTSWAWGDYGLTRPFTVTMDLAKFQQGWDEGQRGRLVRLIIHEFAHAVNTDRFENPPYWQRTNELFRTAGPITEYGSSPDETFAEAVGYYVARCAAGNPYDQTASQPYYDLVRTEIFDGHEFGTAVGERQVCAGEEG